MDQQKIGKFIQEKRKEKGFTQLEFAEKLGVSNRTISKWENGNGMPDYSIFQDLCNELDVSINELLSGEKLTEENYQKKLEENMVGAIDYNNKKRNKKIILFIIIIIVLLLLRLLYKAFLLSYYDARIGWDDYSRDFPYNKNIYEVNVHDNGKANTVYDDHGIIHFYVPDGFEIITDKSKSRFVMDQCDLYTKNHTAEDEFDAMILVCPKLDSIYNLEKYDIRDTYFPFFVTSSILEKYNIENTMNLIRYWEKHYEDKYTVFTSSDKIKMRHIARQYTLMSVPSYDNFYFLSGDYTGYLTETYPTGEDMGNYSWGKGSYYFSLYTENGSYDIAFHNNKEEYFHYDNVFEIVDSVYH